MTGHPGVPPNEPRWLRTIDRTSAVLAAVSGTAVAVLVGTIVIDVAGRAWFNRPLGPALDLSSLALMPTLIALALAHALRRDEHIRAGLLTASASPRVQRIVEVVAMTITAAVSLVVAGASALGAMQAADIAETAVTTRWLYTWPWMIMVAIGFLALALQAVAQLVRALFNRDFHRRDEVETILQEAEDSFRSEVEAGR